MPEQHRVDFEKSHSALKQMLLRLMPKPGNYPTPVKGLVLHRFNSGTDPKPYFYESVIIVVVQGKKRVRIGNEDIAYGDRSCFIAGVSIPVSGCVMEASPNTPYLALSLNLDRSLIAALAAKVPPAAEPGDRHPAGAIVQKVSPELFDAFLRLLAQMEHPEHAKVLGPLICQEIHFRLLTTPFGNQLRMLNTFGSQSNQISRAIAWLKDNYTQPLHVDELAGRLHMATSTFCKYFKKVTTLSPLQYQKRLRLAEAQRLMLSGNFNVTQAAFAVGYESPSSSTGNANACSAKRRADIS